MKAEVTRTGPSGLTHRTAIRSHVITLDEPRDAGGADEGPTPTELLAAALAGCVAITIEMYAARKGWELGEIQVDCSYEQPERGDATAFELLITVPRQISDDEAQRLLTIARKCPVHRVLDGEVRFSERLETAATS